VIFDHDLHGGGLTGIWLAKGLPGSLNKVKSILIDEDQRKMPGEAIEIGIQVFYSVETGCERQSETVGSPVRNCEGILDQTFIGSGRYPCSAHRPGTRGRRINDLAESVGVMPRHDLRELLGKLR